MNNLKTTSDGLLTGCASTLLFNPFDRALYLSVKDKTKILNPSNWRQPYQGASKALYGRIISYGVYLSLFDIYSNFFTPRTPQPVLAASLATAVSTVSLSHGLNVLKMYQWSHEGESKLLTSLQHMVREYGWTIFFRGFAYTCIRDCLFSACYFSLSRKFNEEKIFSRNVVIASLSTTLASPVNYLRSRLFFNFNEERITFRQTLQEICRETAHQESLYRKITYILQDRLKLGLGTLRVGAGMAVADKIYTHLKETDYPPFHKK